MGSRGRVKGVSLLPHGWTVLVDLGDGKYSDTQAVYGTAPEARAIADRMVRNGEARRAVLVQVAQRIPRVDRSQTAEERERGQSVKDLQDLLRIVELVGLDSRYPLVERLRARVASLVSYEDRQRDKLLADAGSFGRGAAGGGA